MRHFAPVRLACLRRRCAHLRVSASMSFYPKASSTFTPTMEGVVSAGVMATVMGLPIQLAPSILELVNQALRRKPPGSC